MLRSYNNGVHTDSLRSPVTPMTLGMKSTLWVEQVLFRPDGEVAALVDWTDGAGRVGFLVEDLDTGIHLSALDLEGIGAFVAGYQSENPLPEQEWRALAALLCYGHLASTNFLGGWFARPYRRMQEWEETSTLWHRLVPWRFNARAEVEETILAASSAPSGSRYPGTAR
ncbi:MAG: hypothetical protein ACOY94_14730 [Bacillota bacterium]